MIMLTKTNELTGPALDWAVAKCEGDEVRYEGGCIRPALSQFVDDDWYQPSTDWNQGGPIIEREGICLKKGHSGWWIAKLLDVNDEEYFVMVAPTPLIAAMRCYVMDNLGNEVDIPKELL